MRDNACLGKFIDTVKETLESRGEGYEGDVERSMESIVKIHNAICDKNMTELDGWMFMICLKLGRIKEGEYKEDNYIDLAGYVALYAEAARHIELSKNPVLNRQS